MNDKNKKPSRKVIIYIILIEAICLIGAIFIINLIIPLRDNPINAISNLIPSQKESTAHIPNLLIHEVIDHLQKNNFVCLQREFNNNLYSWQCNNDLEDIEYELLIFSRNNSDIDLIDANIVQLSDPDNNIAIEYLCQVATYPFDFKQQSDSCDWIKTTLPEITRPGDLHENEFNDVRHLLYGTAEARSLELGQLP